LSPWTCTQLSLSKPGLTPSLSLSATIADSTSTVGTAAAGRSLSANYVTTVGRGVRRHGSATANGFVAARGRGCWNAAAGLPMSDASLTTVTTMSGAATAMSVAKPVGWPAGFPLGCSSNCDGFREVSCAAPSFFYECPDTTYCGTRGSRISGCRLSES